MEANWTFAGSILVFLGAIPAFVLGYLLHGAPVPRFLSKALEKRKAGEQLTSAESELLSLARFTRWATLGIVIWALTSFWRMDELGVPVLTRYLLIAIPLAAGLAANELERKGRAEPE